MSDEKTGFVSLVGAGPGDPGLLTLRGQERLSQADVVVYDRLANPLLLRLAPQAEMIPVGKQPKHHPVPQEQITSVLVAKANEGKRVVRLKGGDPFVFGRGGEEALALAEAGIPFEIIPGVTSAIAVPAYAGIPLTLRGIANSAALITGHRAEKVTNPEEGWEQGSLGADTLVFLMGVKNLPAIVENLLENGRQKDTPAALIERGTTATQKTVSGTLSNISKLAEEISPPAILIIGDVVHLRDQLRWFDDANVDRPLFGLRILNTKSTQNGKTLPWDNFDEQAASLGAEVIHMPVIRIVPPTDSKPFTMAVQHLVEEQAYAWVLLTSANGVIALFEQLSALGLDARALQGIKFGVVGNVTAQALSSRGVVPDFIPSSFIGAELGKQLPLKSGQRILLPRSEIALPDLPEILETRGAAVDEVSAYSVDTAPVDSSSINQLLEGTFDIVMLFSPSGVFGLRDMLANAGSNTPIKDILATTTIACIGPTTSKIAQEMGLNVEIVANEHTSSGLVKELVRWRKHS